MRLSRDVTPRKAMMLTLKDLSLAEIKMEALDVEIKLLEDALGGEFSLVVLPPPPPLAWWDLLAE